MGSVQVKKGAGAMLAVIGVKQEKQKIT